MKQKNAADTKKQSREERRNSELRSCRLPRRHRAVPHAIGRSKRVRVRVMVRVRVRGRVRVRVRVRMRMRMRVRVRVRVRVRG